MPRGPISFGVFSSPFFLADEGHPLSLSLAMLPFFFRSLTRRTRFNEFMKHLGAFLFP